MVEKQDSLAEKLEKLFDEVRKPDGTKYTQTEVVEGTHGVLTRVYLWKLRTGRAVNPGFHVVQAISGFFGVEPSYFFESTEGDSAMAERAEPEDELVKKIKLRSGQLDEAGRKAILDMIDYILSTQKGGSDESKEM